MNDRVEAAQFKINLTRETAALNSWCALHMCSILWKYDRMRDTGEFYHKKKISLIRTGPTSSSMYLTMHYSCVVSFRLFRPSAILAFMESIGGIDAIRMMQEVSKLPDGRFTIAFFKYNRTREEASPRLQVRKRCKARAQLPQERFQIPSDNYFLFEDEEGNPKTCFRVLVRFVGFPPEYKLLKVNWFKDE